MQTVQAYRFALDLSPAQRRQVLAHAGAARVAHNWAVAYNWALARVKSVMGQRAAERSYGIADEQLTMGVSWSLPGLRKAWNVAKPVVAPWWAQCSKEAFNTSAIRVAPDRKHVVLPRLGRLKLHESARKLARRIDNGTARIMSATVRRDGGRWYVAFTVQIERAQRTPARPGAVVGVDVGISHLAVLSTGEVIPNPRHLDHALWRLRGLGQALSRRGGPDRRTGSRPSRRWQRVKARLGRAHARVANLRRDGLHKITTRLARTFGIVVVEDLNVAGKTKLALSERTFHCSVCGLVLDRDLNAARNLAALAATVVETEAMETDPAGSGPVAGRGADRKTRTRGRVAVKRPPGTTPAGKAGTVAPQGAAA